MLGLKLHHVNKRGHWKQLEIYSNQKTQKFFQNIYSKISKLGPFYFWVHILVLLTGTWAWWHHNSLWVQQFVETKLTTRNINVTYHWPFVRGIHWWLVDSAHKGTGNWESISMSWRDHVSYPSIFFSIHQTEPQLWHPSDLSHRYLKAMIC